MSLTSSARKLNLFLQLCCYNLQAQRNTFERYVVTDLCSFNVSLQRGKILVFLASWHNFDAALCDTPLWYDKISWYTARNTKSLSQKYSQRVWEVIIKDKLAYFSFKSNCADHKENLNEPRGRLAWLFWAMYKLASCSSSISKYSCLALFSPLASLCLPSLASSPFFPPSLLLRLTPLSIILLFTSFCSSPFLPPSPPVCTPLPLWGVPDSYKSADVNHHVLALCSTGYSYKATKSLLISAWMW